jgi:hypothetical protein
MTKAVSQQVVVIAGASSAFFENARSRLGAMPKPPPPVYPPELVAEAIVRAAAHPRREIPVGGAAAALMLAQRLAPALTDAVLAVRRVGEGSQRTPRADDGGDNLDAPLPGPGSGPRHLRRPGPPAQPVHQPGRLPAPSRRAAAQRRGRAQRPPPPPSPFRGCRRRSRLREGKSPREGCDRRR